MVQEQHLSNEIDVPIIKSCFLEQIALIRSQLTMCDTLFIISHALLNDAMLQRRSTAHGRRNQISAIVVTQQDVGADGCSSIKRQGMSSTRNIAGLKRGMAAQREVAAHMVECCHVAVGSLDKRRQQLAAIIRSRCAGAGKPVVGAPLVFDELREPCKVGIGIEDYMVRNTDGEQSAFGNTIDGDR